MRIPVQPCEGTCECWRELAKKVDGRTVRFELTDTPGAGGALFAEPARDNYL